jgi:hypothetical protein
MATVPEIVDRAAADLGILRLNQALQAQDKTRITSGYYEIHADLKQEGIAFWPKEGPVPDEFTPHVVALVAMNSTATYGISDGRYKRIVENAKAAKREIRRVGAPSYISTDETTDF